MEVESITAKLARPIRHMVLRPNAPPEDSIYPGDDEPGTFHGGLYDGADLVAVASVFNEPPPGENDPDAWRIRGMAVLPKYQHRGYGTKLLEICIAYVNESDASQLWGNARTGAKKFYEAEGFKAEGDVFELPHSGPHYFMRLRL